MAQSYSALLSSIRACESELDSHHAKYAQYAGRVSTLYASSSAAATDAFSSSADECAQLEGSIERELERLGSLVEALERVLEQHSNTAQRHTLAIHSDALHDRARRYTRTQLSLREATDRAALLSSVRADISSYNAHSANSDPDAQQAAFLAERAHIDSSIRLTDRILEQAYETRDDFFRQKDILLSARARMSSVASSLPSLNSIMSMIRTRRRRDSIILGSLIALCTLFLLWYITS